MKVSFYETSGGWWHWTIRANNNVIVARSGRAHRTRRVCERAFWNFAVDMSGDPSLHKVIR